MSQSMNRVILTGNLTRDPEIKQANSGVAICELGVAVNDRKKINGEWTDHASFFDVTVFGHTAEACGKYLSRGKPVAVDGKLEQQRWEKDGEKRSKVVVIAQQVQFLGGRDEAPGTPVDTSDFADF